MSHEPAARRSRIGWPLRHPDPDVPVHDHELPAWLLRVVWALVALVVALAAAMTLLLIHDVQQQTYIEGRGEFRDQEAARLEVKNQERIRRAICDLLDQFPEGGLLDRPRSKYGCGPGIPLSSYPADVQDQLRDRYGDRPRAVIPQPTGEPRPAWPGTGSAPQTPTRLEEP